MEDSRCGDFDLKMRSHCYCYRLSVDADCEDEWRMNQAREGGEFEEMK